jgi:hypothetical protein
MILGFKTQINGKPTYFVEKIWEGFFKGVKINYQGLEIGKKALPENYIINTHKPKIHTIREDKNNRWKPGTMIDFFINVRKKDMYRFAPRIPVLSTQKIEIIWLNEIRSLELSKLAPKRLNYVEVIVDDNVLEFEEMKILSLNDGFDTIEEFFEYFNENFKGKIIHWTDKRY